MATRDDWSYGDGTSEGPPVAGWFAIMYCWSVESGIFSGADQWDGSGWAKDLPVTAWRGPFATVNEAQAWADAHDPDLQP